MTPAPLPSGDADRAFLLDLLLRMAEPVLAVAAQGRLVEAFPLELSPDWRHDARVAHLECFGRLMSGLAPWLALGADDTAEGRLRGRLAEAARDAYAHAVYPRSPGYLQWRDGMQPLVDAAYFAQAMLRAPAQLWEPLNAITRRRIIAELSQLRRVKPFDNNWVLFRAIIEGFLLAVGEAADLGAIAHAVSRLELWYVGDGWYSDGHRFRTDYYNSYVMHPMLFDVLTVLEQTGTRLEGVSLDLKTEVGRLQRYCEILERLIGPDGSFPPIGRSLTYRTGAFQALALAAWKGLLPSSLPKAQVRAALAAVHRRVFADPAIFTADGFLQLGIAGHQPGVAEFYGNNGSAYLTANGLLMLGIPAGDPFWTDPALDWTARRAFAGEPVPRDAARD